MAQCLLNRFGENRMPDHCFRAENVPFGINNHIYQYGAFRVDLFRCDVNILLVSRSSFHLVRVLQDDRSGGVSQ